MNSSLANLIDGFRLSCQTEGKSPRTVEWYVCFLERFNEFLTNRKLPSDVKEIDITYLRTFVRYLQTEARNRRNGNALSVATVQGYCRTLKAFFSWLMREGYIESNPTYKLPIPKGAGKLINTFGTDQITRLIEVCQRADDLGQRNLAIFLLLLDSGIRVSELVSINLEDVDLAEGHIKIRIGKGNKERIVPIGSLVQKALWKYINNSRAQPITDKVRSLFLSNNGLPLTRSGIQQLIRRCGKRAGINGVRCSPHTLRHTFSRNYLVNGGDIFSLQRILGHSSLASVRTYLNLFAEDIKRQHQRFSPVDNLVDNREFCSLVRSSIYQRR
jgi:integrase/recombinase XerD